VAALEAQQGQERAERRALVDASKEAVAGLSVGQKVTYTRGGSTYTATVTKVARSKVTIAYRIKSGAERTKVVHAALVTPAETQG